MCRLVTQINTFTAYWLDAAASNLTGPAPSDWSKVGTITPVPLGPTLGYTVSGNTTERGYMFSASGVPGTAGVGGTWQLILRLAAANSSVRLSGQVHRVNSSGVIQASSAATAEQTVVAGVMVFNINATGLGTWAAGDRIRCDIIVRNTSGSSKSITFTLGQRVRDVIFSDDLDMVDSMDVLSSQVI